MAGVRKASGAPVSDVERRLAASTDTEGAIYRANHRGKLHDMSPVSQLWTGEQFSIARAQRHPTIAERFGPIARLEDQPRLDLRSLAAHGFLREGELTELRLIWDEPKLDVFLYIGLRPGDQPFVSLKFRQDEVVTNQIIGLTPRLGSARHRYRFVIPGYGCAEVLACRFHRFAPAKQQRLVHSSQRKPQLSPTETLEAALLKRAAAKSKPA